MLFEKDLLRSAVSTWSDSLAALANDRGHYRVEVVMVECATGPIDFGRGADQGDDDPPKMRRVAKDLDGFLKMLKRPS